MSKLWQISSDLAALSDRIALNGGEITPEIEAALDEIGGRLDDKIEKIALLIRERILDAEKAGEEEARLKAIRKAFEREAEGLKTYLKLCMERAGIDRVETHRARVALHQNPQPRITWEGEASNLPEQYRRITIAPNLDAVRDDLREGRTPPDGFKVTNDTHIRIF